MNLSELISFEQALDAHMVRSILPTTASSADLLELQARLKRQALFSARTDNAWYLQQIDNAIESIVNPHTEIRADRISAANPEGKVTIGSNQADAELILKEALQQLRYQPHPDERGTLKDLSSLQRRRLVVRTNVQLAQGAGHFMQANEPTVLDAFPAQELVRFEQRVKQRDWGSRWLSAATASGDTDAARIYIEFGRMVARKDSPIWDSLGDPDLFPDGLGNPYPPFAYGSGMWVQDVDFETAEKMGLVTPSSIPEPQDLEIGGALELPTEIRDENLRAALIASLGDQVEFVNGVMQLLNRRGDLIQHPTPAVPTHAITTMIALLDVISGGGRQ